MLNPGNNSNSMSSSRCNGCFKSIVAESICIKPLWRLTDKRAVSRRFKLALLLLVFIVCKHAIGPGPSCLLRNID